MTGHSLFDVSWVTTHTVGWTPVTVGGQVPIIETLPMPHARWYCECGTVSRRFRSNDQAEAQAKAIKAHAAHAAENDVPTVGTEEER